MPIRVSYTSGRTTQISIQTIRDSLGEDVEFSEDKEKDPGPSPDILTTPIQRVRGRVKDIGVDCFASYFEGGRLQLIIADNNGVDPEHKRLQSIRARMGRLGITPDERTKRREGYQDTPQNQTDSTQRHFSQGYQSLDYCI